MPKYVGEIILDPQEKDNNQKIQTDKVTDAIIDVCAVRGALSSPKITKSFFST